MRMKLTRFADVVALAKDRAAEPLSVGLERFVGLEHIESENLHIRSWGNVAEGTTFTNVFRKGQVLFGKRRAYQRKVAVAEFDGVCSGDIYVFESQDPDMLLPDLLPFILQSEGFYEYAVKTSAGSLSPRTNWTHLAEYEFPLPPLDEQRRIAALLWAADDVIERSDEATAALRKVKQAIASSFFSKDIPYSRSKLGNLSLRKPQYGANAPAVPYKKECPRFIRITDIDDFGELGTDIVGLQSADWKDYLLEDGDFMFARTGATVGKTYVYKSEHGLCVYAGYLVRFKLDRDLILPEYLFEFIKTLNHAWWIKNTVRVGAQQISMRLNTQVWKYQHQRWMSKEPFCGAFEKLKFE